MTVLQTDMMLPHVTVVAVAEGRGGDEGQEPREEEDKEEEDFVVPANRVLREHRLSYQVFWNITSLSTPKDFAGNR